MLARSIAVTLVVGSGLLGSAVVGQPAPADSAVFHRPARSPQLPPLRVEVLDGRRFRDVETGDVYRLYGIDTCAPDQTATLGRQPWPCGATATAWLVGATLNRWLSCAVVREESGERLARCASSGHADVAADMLRDGAAVMLPPSRSEPTIRGYEAAERDARKAVRGLWASSFQMPWEYRRSGAQEASHSPAAAGARP